MVRLKNVEKVYRTESIETLALHDINIEVEKGEFVSVMGPSGCGKSTLLNLMGLLDTPTKGEVEIEGSPVKSYGDRKLAKLRNEKIGFIFQSFHLISDLNVVDNVEIPLLYRHESSSKRRKLALAALEKVGLSARTKHFPGQLHSFPAAQLNGGQQPSQSHRDQTRYQQQLSCLFVPTEPRRFGQHLHQGHQRQQRKRCQYQGGGNWGCTGTHRC